MEKTLEDRYENLTLTVMNFDWLLDEQLVFVVNGGNTNSKESEEFELATLSAIKIFDEKQKEKMKLIRKAKLKAA